MLELFRQDILNVPTKNMLHNNSCRSLLLIGEAMLIGELSYREGDYTNAFESLRIAMKLSDGLVYDEPWGWMQPPRHALGALLLEQVCKENRYRVFVYIRYCALFHVW